MAAELSLLAWATWLAFGSFVCINLGPCTQCWAEVCSSQSGEQIILACEPCCMLTKQLYYQIYRAWYVLLLPCTLPGGNKKTGSRSKDQGPKHIKTNVCYRAALPTQCGEAVANDSQPFLYLLLSLKQNLAIFRSSHLPSFKASHRNFIIFPWIFTKWFVCLCTVYGGSASPT